MFGDVANDPQAFQVGQAPVSTYRLYQRNRSKAHFKARNYSSTVVIAGAPCFTLLGTRVGRESSVSKYWRQSYSAFKEFNILVAKILDRCGEISSRANTQLLEDLPEMIFNSMGTDEQLGRNLPACQPRCGQARDSAVLVT